MKTTKQGPFIGQPSHQNSTRAEIDAYEMHVAFSAEYQKAIAPKSTMPERRTMRTMNREAKR